MIDKRLKALDRHLTKAITKIVSLMESDLTPPHVQLRAAQVYIELSMKYVQIPELADRLQAIDSHFTTSGQPTPFMASETAIIDALMSDDEQDDEAI